MNCLTCPIAEDCEVSRHGENNVYVGGDSLPTKIVPYRKEECLLIQAIRNISPEVKLYLK